MCKLSIHSSWSTGGGAVAVDHTYILLAGSGSYTSSVRHLRTLTALRNVPRLVTVVEEERRREREREHELGQVERARNEQSSRNMAAAAAAEHTKLTSTFPPNSITQRLDLSWPRCNLMISLSLQLRRYVHVNIYIAFVSLLPG